jgi:type 1 fimbria pilin
MKKFIAILAAGILLAGLTARVWAADTASKEVTITGTMVCGKCTLHETKDCQNVVQVEKDGKTVNYYLTQNKVSKAAHDPICTPGSSEKVTVTGTVKEKDGKEIMTPTKIEPVKS